MYDWMIKHKKECNLDEDTCQQCYHIGESLWSLTEAQEYIEAKKNQPKPAKPKPELKWNYKLGRYM